MLSPIENCPSVAVCLAAFNGVRYLQQQVDSIFDQAGVQITLFVSVDRSTDGTEEWFSKLQTNNTRVVLLPFGESFGGAAQNFFRLLRDIDFAAFDYVAYADQDDIWLPGKLIRATGKMAQTNSDGYSSDIVAFWESGRSTYIKKSYSQRTWDYLFESAGPGCTFVMSQKLALELQSTVRQNGQTTAGVGLHDWFTYAFARAHGYRWIIDDYASLMYRQHDTNQVGVNSGWAAFVWRARRVLSGWGLSQSRLIASLVGQTDHPFVRRWSAGSRWGLLALAFAASHCRRKPLDRVLFVASCLALALMGWK
ncbi:MAG: glycosyltransferase [Rhodoferax sp.]|nr:glycosyltransferase [Rhodoferax sp.]